MKILMLTHRLPYAPNRGDRFRAFHELRYLSSFAEVHLASLIQDEDEGAHARDLDGLAASVTVGTVPWVANRIRGVLSLAGRAPLTHTLLRSRSLEQRVESLVDRVRPDVAFVFCTGVAPLCLRPSLANVPCVLDMVDVDSGKWAALAETARGPLRWVYRREALALSAFESSFVTHARATLVVNEREKRLLESHARADTVTVVENGIDFERLAAPADTVREKRVVFTGVMNYRPNEDGAEWLVRDVWPYVRSQHPDASLQIVGATPSRRVLALASPAHGVVVTGTVPDTRPYLWGARVAAAPLWVARGVQSKVLEAVAAGLPTVVTPPVHEGLPGPCRAACDVAANAPSFARLLSKWLTASEADREARRSGVDFSDLSWPVTLAPLRRILEAAVAGRPSDASSRQQRPG